MSVEQTSMNQLITDNIDIWTSTVKTKSASGRGSSKKRELYGVKKLRELILELAVRGKLVPQDPTDEPASVLLERIAEEKAQLVKEKKIKKQKTLPEVTEQEAPFSVPKGWEWTRLGNLSSDIHYGYTASAKPDSEGVRLLRITDIQNDKVNWGTVPACEITDEKAKSYLLENDDILIARTGGTIGKSYLVENIDLQAVFASYLIRVKRIKAVYAPFIKVFLGSQLYWKQLIENSAGTGQPNVNATALKQLLFIMPPFEQQHRIVAKVDELMTLCDQLEQQTEASIEAHQVLVTTLLDTLTNSADAEELMQNWARISEHFDTLFTTEASIDQLKQTILQLAVMGKLSKPLDSDTPVSNHLDSILEQQKLTASAKEFKLIEAELESAKAEVGANRVMLKARCFCDFITKGTTPSKTELLEIGDVPFLKVYNIVDNQLDFDYRPIFISQGVHEGKLKRSMASPGDVIMNIVGPPLGKVTILTDQYTQWNMNQALAVFKPVDVVFNRYLYYVLSCDLTLNSVLKEVKGTAGQDNLSLEQCRDLLIPIIGIEEQKRLVELVDILLEQCKFLKTRLKESQTTQLHLTDAIVEQAV
ncbi:restriction endonuclease subunit S [Vibrio sp. nBUS_14]|uniref:restriction endonuclease subunit S n=1 Tax=Vibrio sp. nBUS_14 TaxID=3395321 RepID=UPI003EBB41B5